MQRFAVALTCAVLALVGLADSTFAQTFDPAQSLLIVPSGNGGHDGGNTNVACTFSVQCRDTSGSNMTQSPGNPDLLWAGSYLVGPEILALAYDDPNDGTINFAYTATIPGIYELHVIANGVEISGSPRIVVIAGHTAETSTAAGVGVSGGSYVGQVVSFSVQARDANGGLWTTGNDNFTVTVMRANKRVPVVFVGNQNGTYSGFYFVDKAGLYEVSITLDGVPIADAPFRPVFTK